MPAETIYSINALAGLSGYDRRTVAKILGDKKQATLRDFCEGLRQHYEGGVTSSRERRAAAQAEMIELDLAERRHDLVSTEDMKFLVQGLIVSARGKLLHLPEKLVHYCHVTTLPDAEAQAAIDREIRDALAELSEPERHAWWEGDTEKPAWITPFHDWIKNFPPPPDTLHTELYDKKNTTGN